MPDTSTSPIASTSVLSPPEGVGHIKNALNPRIPWGSLWFWIGNLVVFVPLYVAIHASRQRTLDRSGFLAGIARNVEPVREEVHSGGMTSYRVYQMHFQIVSVDVQGNPVSLTQVEMRGGGYSGQIPEGQEVVVLTPPSWKGEMVNTHIAYNQTTRTLVRMSEKGEPWGYPPFSGKLFA